MKAHLSTTAPSAPEPADTGETADYAGAPGRARLALWAGAGLLLTAAGILLWSARGAAVFTDVLATAVAWCF